MDPVDIGSADRTPDLSPRAVDHSRSLISQLMEVTDANIAGTVHGGTIMKLVDTAAGLAAIRHAGGLCVTVAIDQMSFRSPAKIGNVLHVMASVNDVGTTSLECGVRVEAEDVVTGERVHTNSAYLVFVAVDREGRPRPVPPLLTETPDDERRRDEARLRRTRRLAHEADVQAHRASRDDGPA